MEIYCRAEPEKYGKKGRNKKNRSFRTIINGEVHNILRPAQYDLLLQNPKDLQNTNFVNDPFVISLLKLFFFSFN
jgi:hypothetical protein